MTDETIIDNTGVNAAPQQSNSVNTKSNTRNTVNNPENPTNPIGKQEKNTGKYAAAAAAGGAAGIALGLLTPLHVFPKGSSENVTINENEESAYVLQTDLEMAGHEVEVATNVDDSMSFHEAFAAAREEVGAGGLFVWHGHTFGTYYMDEWDALSPEEQDQYWTNMNYTTDNINDEIEEEGKIEDEGEIEGEEEIEGEDAALDGDPVDPSQISTSEQGANDLEVATSVNDTMSFSQAFAAARQELGAGGLFTWHGHNYNTYYAEEWNSMSQDDKDQFWANVQHTTSHPGAAASSHPFTDPTIGTTVAAHDVEVATSVNDSMSFNQAFATARQEVGAGGLFSWHGHNYNTYYAEEWNSMTQDEKDQYFANVQHTISHQDNPYITPGPVQDPETLSLLDVDLLELYDTDDDGIVDAISADVNYNDTPDLVIDTDGDGTFDTLILDPVVNENDELTFTDIQEINDVEIIPTDVILDEDIPPVAEDSQSHSDVDLFASNTIDPDIPIDNNLSMGDFV